MPTKIWATLPNLPLVFWNELVFKSIGNKIRSFFSSEPRREMKANRCWVWVQISVDLKEGMTNEIELEWGDFKWVQKIDYWRVPFRCYGCHQASHVQDECRRAPVHFPPFQRIWKQKSSVVSSDGIKGMLAAREVGSTSQSKGNASYVSSINKKIKSKPNI